MLFNISNSKLPQHYLIFQCNASTVYHLYQEFRFFLWSFGMINFALGLFGQEIRSSKTSQNNFDEKHNSLKTPNTTVLQTVITTSVLWYCKWQSQNNRHDRMYVIFTVIVVVLSNLDSQCSQISCKNSPPSLTHIVKVAV